MWRLSKIDIRGFKSFADKAELIFPEGITAVVGPNGCGKSNISDAIVWALGEQSTTVLRAQKMHDVIFQGTAQRKGTGVAEVTLHLRARRRGAAAAAGGNGDLFDPSGNGHRDAAAAAAEGAPAAVGGTKAGAPAPAPRSDEANGEEPEEITITRRLYRSGDSEYLINGERCLLREIRERLLGTGLGARACFTIGQGRIDQILSASPLERRIPLEEAAGISLYRGRRHRTQLKLEATAQDLARVEDICAEVARQMRSLKRQAGKAKRYRRLRQRLRELEGRWFALRVHELEHALALGQASLRAVTLAEQSAREALETATRAWEAARRRWREQRQRQAQRRQQLYHAQVELERARADAARAQDRARFARERLGELERKLAEFGERFEDARAIVEVRREAAARADEAARAAERVLQDATEQLDPASQIEQAAAAAEAEEQTLELRPLAAGIDVGGEHRGAVALALGQRLRLPLLGREHLPAWLEAVAERRGTSRALRVPATAREPEAAPDPAVLGALRDVVAGADPEVQSILDHLLARTWLVADRETALRLAAEHPEEAFVDPAGSVWARGAEVILRNESAADVIADSAAASQTVRLRRRARQAPAVQLPSAEQEAARLAVERARAALQATIVITTATTADEARRSIWLSPFQ